MLALIIGGFNFAGKITDTRDKISPAHSRFLTVSHLRERGEGMTRRCFRFRRLARRATFAHYETAIVYDLDEFRKFPSRWLNTWDTGFGVAKSGREEVGGTLFPEIFGFCSTFLSRCPEERIRRSK